MVWNLPAFILFFLILLVYFVRPSWVLLLWLITTPFLAPIMVLYSDISDFQDVQSYVWGIWGIYNRAYLLIILFELFVRGSNLRGNFKPLLVPAAILAFYLTVHNLATYPNFMKIFGHYMGIIYTVPPLLALMLNKKMWPSFKSIFWVLIIVYLIEILWIPLNANGVYAYVARYQELLKGELLLTCGTFTRSNMLADYVAITYFFVMLDFFSRKTVSTFWFIVFSALAFVLLFSAGSKLPIVVVFAGLMMGVVLFKRDKMGVMFTSLVAFAGFLFLLNNYQNEIESDNEGLNRIVNGLGEFAQSQKSGGSIDDVSTFAISGEVIDRYFWNSPIFGNGNTYKYENIEDAYYVSIGEVNLTADATFAYYLIEYGILGIIVFAFFYYNVIRCTCSIVPEQRKKLVLIIFTFLLLFSATEGGLFNKGLYTYVYMFLFAAARSYEEKSKLSAVKQVKLSYQ